jgi:photosystem II stability/assembly factor-like uncharacterized protein
MFLPVFLLAQWNPVRFDHYNSFHKVFAATANDAFVIGADPAGQNFFIRTSDGGATWDSISIVSNGNFQLSELYFTDVTNGFAGGFKNNSYQGLLKTTNNGTTWTEITPDPASNEPITAVYFLNPAYGFATSSAHLYSTTNGGTTWTTQALSFYPTDIHFSTMNDGYVSGTDNTSNAIILQTHNGGASWTNLLTQHDPNLFVSEFIKEDVLPNNVLVTAMQNTNRIYKSHDGGATWTTITVDSIFSIRDFQFTTDMIGHVLSDYGQIYVTEDGGQTWNLEYATEWGFYGPSIYLYSISFVEETGYSAGTSGLVKKHTIATGIQEAVHTEVGGISIYPSCYTWGMALNIELKENFYGGKLKIYSTSGKEMYSEEVSKDEPFIELQNLYWPAGVYYVSFETKSNRSVEKFVMTGH